MKLDAMKRQAGRPRENGGQIDPHLIRGKSRDIFAEEVGESSKQISRYIRLTYLVPVLLDHVDNKTMAFNAAGEVSYLTELEQKMLCEAIEREECTPNLMDAIMTEEKPIEDKLVLKGDVLAKYFPKSYTPSQKQRVIVKLLEDWHKRQSRQQER